MKNTIFAIVILLLTSCAGAYKQASHLSNKAYVGMPITEFRNLAGKKASLETLEAGYTVYRMNDYDAWTGAITNVKFYYFDSSAKLVKIDGGEFKQRRYQLEIVKQ